MDNIEERAKKYKLTFSEGNVKKSFSLREVQRLLVKTTIRSAEEQKRIDDEENSKALLYCTDKTATRVAKEMIDKVWLWVSKNRFAIHMNDEETLKKLFRKAVADKRNPLFDSCLANVDPEIREEVRRNMDARLVNR